MNLTLIEGKKKKRYTIPNEWNELTLDRYMGIMKFLKDKDKEHDITKVIGILNCLTDVPIEDLYKIEAKSLKDLGAHLTTFMSSEPNDELKHFITIKGVEYGFHPNLSDITLGEFVDLETHMKDINENLHYILSILYRPVIAKEGDKYAIEEYEFNEDTAKLFREHLKVDDFNGASVFFYDLARELSISSLKSLTQMIKQDQKKRKESKVEQLQ